MARSIRRRPLAGAILSIVLAGGVAACGDPATVSSSAVISETTGADGEIPLSVTADPAALDLVRRSIGALLGAPAVELWYGTTAVAGATSSGTASIDAAAGSYASSQTLYDPSGKPTITVEQVLLRDAMYTRFVPADEVDVPWTKVDVGTAAGEFLAGAYTVDGSILPSLDRLVLLMESVPSTVRPLEVGSLAGYEITFDAGAISRFYRDSATELVSAADAVGTTLFEVWARNGTLARLRALGTHFHDGEAIEDVNVLIEYEAVESVEIRVPND